MSEDRKDQILAVLSDKGALGVNALARETGIPLSTLQKYLHGQSYFRMNEAKKWDLPEKVTSDVKANTMSLMLNSLETAILLVQSQIEETRHSIANTLVPIESLKRNFKHIQLSVAECSHTPIHPKFQELSDDLDKLPGILKSKKDAISEENYQFLQNVDWHALVAEMGSLYFTNTLSTDIYDLLLGQTAQLSEDSLTILKEYQK